MADTSSSCLFSQPFQFIVENTTIYVHPEPISRLSGPLKSLIDGPMSEAQERVAILEDVSASTFIRVCEWAYIGLYNAPYFVPLKSTDEEQSGFSFLGSTLPGLRAKFPVPAAQVESRSLDSDDLPPWEAFLELKKHFPNPFGAPRLIRLKRDNTSIVREALEPQVDLYIFSDKYDIQDLKTHTLNEIHQTLSNVKDDRKSVNELVELAKQIYDRTVRRGSSIVDIRTVLKYFFDACLPLLDVKALQTLMENEDLQEDILAMVVKKIRAFPKPIVNIFQPSPKPAGNIFQRTTNPAVNPFQPTTNPTVSRGQAGTASGLFSTS